MSTSEQLTPGDSCQLVNAELMSAGASQTLVQGAGFKVVRKIFPQPVSVPEHHAPGSALIQCLHGRADLHAMGKVIALTPGTFIMLGPRERHSLTCTNPQPSWSR